jgi:molybdopterin biosynthesis enzyme
MLLFEKALDTVLSSALPLGTERVGIIDVANRILTEDVKSDIGVAEVKKGTSVTVRLI